MYKRKIKQVIPPQSNAVVSKKGGPPIRPRDKAIKAIAHIGRTAWKVVNKYHQRSKAETAMLRYKAIIGDHLSARKIENQRSEVKIGCKILNIMLQINKPISSKVA